MGKKKSLGSSPIGQGSMGDNSYNFIRDLGVSSRKEESEESDIIEYPRKEEKNGSEYPGSNKNIFDDQQNKKKIVSYYLETDLIDRLKTMADDRDTFYSALVSEALEVWIEAHGY